ncbi:hypothetical protein Droror1_Dr00024773 [Drosera rotundifolia]
MSDGGLKLLDGTHLTTTIAAPFSDPSAVSGAEVIDFADSIVSKSLYGLRLPVNRRAVALERVGVLDEEKFRGEEVEKVVAERVMREYVNAVAEGLRDDPLLVAVLDGSTLRLFLDDEDDFAMLAENLFTELDTEDEGKLSKSEIRNALVQMGIETGVPSFSDFPILNGILKAHGAEGDDKLGQAQFAQLLQLVLQDLAAALAENPVVSIQNIKIVNGSYLRKLLADEKQLEDITEKIYRQWSGSQQARSCAGIIRSYLEEHGELLGQISLKVSDSVMLLYDDVFASIDTKRSIAVLEKNELGELVKEILDKLARQLDASPVLQDLDN